MKKIISLLCALVLIVSCTEQAYYEIPLDANGNVYLTTISSTTSAGISTLDAGFSVTAKFPNAKSGDVMKVELLKLQTVTGSATKQLLPMAGTQQDVTVGADLMATVTYTRAVAMLTMATEYVTVVFNGMTDYAKVRVDMVPATVVQSPRVSTPGGTPAAMVKVIPVDVARTAETAYFWVTVRPKTAGYTYTLDVTRKNGAMEAPVTVMTAPFFIGDTIAVPISGADFAPMKDSMIYTFTAMSGTYTEAIMSKVVVRDPYFYLKKTATLTLGSATDGLDLLINKAVEETDVTASLAVMGSLMLKGGTAWLAAGNMIEFVPTTMAMYTKNNSSDAIAAFMAGAPTTMADPGAGEGCYVYKFVNGASPANVYYGMIKVLSVVPGVSVGLEFRIGDQYAHLLVIK